MHRRAGEIVAGARGCIGTRFRPQGRTVGVGLDCIGVAIVAARAGGVRVADQADYDLRGDGAAALDAALVRAGFRAVAAAEAGDLMLFAPRAGLRHVAVACGGERVVHAHAGLRRVVEGPVDEAWRPIGVWRMPGE